MDKLIKASLIASIVTIGGNMEKLQVDNATSLQFSACGSCLGMVRDNGDTTKENKRLKELEKSIEELEGKVSRRNAKIDRRNVEINNLRGDSKILKEKIEGLEKENKRLKELEKRIKELEGENEQLKENIRRRERDIGEHQERINDLTKLVKDSNKLRVDVDKLESKAFVYKKDIKSLEKLNKDLRESNKALGEDNSLLRKKLEELDERNRKLERDSNGSKVGNRKVAGQFCDVMTPRPSEKEDDDKYSTEDNNPLVNIFKAHADGLKNGINECFEKFDGGYFPVGGLNSNLKIFRRGVTECVNNLIKGCHSDLREFSCLKKETNKEGEYSVEEDYNLFVSSLSMRISDLTNGFNGCLEEFIKNTFITEALKTRLSDLKNGILGCKKNFVVNYCEALRNFWHLK